MHKPLNVPINLTKAKVHVKATNYNIVGVGTVGVHMYWGHVPTSFNLFCSVIAVHASIAIQVVLWLS